MKVIENKTGLNIVDSKDNVRVNFVIDVSKRLSACVIVKIQPWILSRKRCV